MKPIIKQKYKIGDKVRIQKDLPESMYHFKSDQEAIILGSYEDQHGHTYLTNPQYAVLLLETGYNSAWYPEEVLHFIEHVGHEGIYDVLEKRRRETEEVVGQAKHNEFVKELSALKELTKEFDVETSIDALIIKMMMEAVAKEKEKQKAAGNSMVDIPVKGE